MGGVSRRRPRSFWLLNAGLAVVGVLAAMLVALALQPKQSPASPVHYTPPAPKPYAVFFGDSYFNGADGVGPLQTYAYLTGAALGYDTVIAGHGGTGYLAREPVKNGAPPYPDQLRQSYYFSGFPRAAVRLVVLEGGINDPGRSLQAEQSAAAVVIRQLHDDFPAARMVVIGPAAPTGVVTPALRVNIAGIRAAAEAAHLPFVDESRWITQSNRSSVIDSHGVHPSVAGHRYLATRLKGALRRLGVAVR